MILSFLWEFIKKNFKLSLYEFKKRFYHLTILMSLMIKIEAIVRSSVLHQVQDALAKVGIPTFSSYQVQITGIHKGHSGWRNKTSDFVPKSKLEILCTEEDEDKIVNAIQKNASTGEKGDGVVFTYGIDKLVKIKSGETGNAALK